MSDQLKHECGIAMLRLLKPLEYYQKKYGTTFYGIQKMYLLLEKQHNRGQDGAGFASIKINAKPGTRYISRVRSNKQHPIQNIFKQINNRINKLLKENPDKKNDTNWQIQNMPYVGNLFLGHVRYGTFGKNSIESVHPFLRQNNWRHKNLIMAGNFNMTNSDELLQELIEIGQHPKESTDTVTIMEKIGHFLDDEVAKIYQKCKKKGISKKEASLIIEKELNIKQILKKASKNWDGGYAMTGLIGHGDAFVLRDPAGIRPAFYYKNEEIVVIASERPVIQTVFNVTINSIKELEPAHALIIKKNGDTFIKKINKPTEKKSCSFERIYFSRGSDADIYKERKNLGKLILPKILKTINNDIDNTVFSYIPNTAETAFIGMTEEVENYLNKEKTKIILKGHRNISAKELTRVLAIRPRIEKIAIKDVKLRTFIADDNSRDDLVAHVYDITYGVVKPTDNLVIIDDSIVRGTTLKKSILQILDKLSPKKIIIVSSAPQIRYPDCYGIDMAKLGNLIAFKATIELLKDTKQTHIIDTVYKKCKKQTKQITNFVKEIYKPFTTEEISNKITEILTNSTINSKVKIIFQEVEQLHQAIPNHKGDWYFTGNYPTVGGTKFANKAFINYYEGNNKRAY